MNIIKNIIPRAIILFVLCTVLCGVVYTGVITGIAQTMFPYRANGSIIEINGKKYGSELLGQYYTDDGHMWGRIMTIDVSTYVNADGQAMFYAAPSNLSPSGKEFGDLVAKRVDKLRAADMTQGTTPIPVDLVTSSGSGLDPHISPAAAAYQVPRIARARGIAEEDVRHAINRYTEEKFLGIFGERTVNVLKVNLMLDGILS